MFFILLMMILKKITINVVFFFNCYFCVNRSNIYSDFAEVLLAKLSRTMPDPLSLDFPTLEDGAHGVKFLEACVESADNNGRWTNSELRDSGKSF